MSHQHYTSGCVSYANQFPRRVVASGRAVKEGRARESFCKQILEMCRRDSVSCAAAIYACLLCASQSLRLAENMLTADVRWLKDKAGPHQPTCAWLQSVTCDAQVSLYTCGFPCTPFSLLHGYSKMLDDPNARQLWRTLHNIDVINPAATCQHDPLHVR